MQVLQIYIGRTNELCISYAYPRLTSGIGMDAYMGRVYLDRLVRGRGILIDHRIGEQIKRSATRAGRGTDVGLYRRLVRAS